MNHFFKSFRHSRFDFLGISSNPCFPSKTTVYRPNAHKRFPRLWQRIIFVFVRRMQDITHVPRSKPSYGKQIHSLHSRHPRPRSPAPRSCPPLRQSPCPPLARRPSQRFAPSRPAPRPSPLTLTRLGQQLASLGSCSKNGQFICLF